MEYEFSSNYSRNQLIIRVLPLVLHFLRFPLFFFSPVFFPKCPVFPAILCLLTNFLLFFILVTIEPKFQQNNQKFEIFPDSDRFKYHFSNIY